MADEFEDTFEADIDPSLFEEDFEDVELDDLEDIDFDEDEEEEITE